MEENMEDISIFDNWNEDDENAAIESIKATYKVRHVIKNGEYWALGAGGVIYKLPLSLSIADFERLVSAQDDVEQISQIKSILVAFAGEEVADKLEREPALFAFGVLQDYGATLSRIQGATLGESAGSVASSLETTEPVFAQTSPLAGSVLLPTLATGSAM